MKTAIGTAHGWISVQPDGRLEFRPLSSTPGPWETFDFPGFGAVPVPGPEPPQSGIPDAIEPVEQTAAYVGRVKAWLQSEGHNLNGPCGAFDIVKNVVWYLFVSGSYGVGLLEKSGGNQCDGYATDIVMYSTMHGQIIDILGDGGGNNTPQWGVSDTVDPARWRPPVQP